MFALVKECSRRFQYVCFLDFEYDKFRDFFEGMLESLFAVCMLLSDDWSFDCSYLVNLSCAEREYFFGGKKN